MTTINVQVQHVLNFEDMERNTAECVGAKGEAGTKS